MKLNDAEKIIDGYASWWKKSIDAYQEGDSIRLVCPMLDRNNDHMSIYIADDSNGGYVLTDLGATINDLRLSGCDVLSSKSREKKLTQALNGYGLLREDDELYVYADSSSLFQRMNMLMQGMASIDDLFFTTKDSVKNLFFEDVSTWLDNNNVRYTSDIRIGGRSGFEIKFDFLIPKTQGIAPERYIKTVSNPTEGSIKNAIFGWDDVSAIRGDSQSYLFLNDESHENVGDRLLQACREYSINPVLWSKVDDVLPALAA